MHCCLQAIVTAGLKPTLDDFNFVGTVFDPANLDSLPVSTPSVNITKVRLQTACAWSQLVTSHANAM